MIISFIHTRAHVIIPVINSNTLSGMEFCFLRGPSALLLLLFLRRVRYQAAYCYERNLDWKKRAEYHWRSFYETSNRFEEEDTRNRGRDDVDAEDGDESGREKIGV